MDDKSSIRAGRVSKINYGAGRAEIVFSDRGNSVTAEIPMVSNGEYKMPKVGQMVSVACNGSDPTSGVIIGTLWTEKNQPTESGEGVYHKEFADEPGEAYDHYSPDDGAVTRHAKEIDLDATETVKIVAGSTTILVDAGGITIDTALPISVQAATINMVGAAGDIKIDGVSLVHHKHKEDGAGEPVK